MRALLPLALLLALPVAAHAQASSTDPAAAEKKDEIVIEGVGLSRDVSCDGKNIGIYGAENKINLTGDCGKVIVHGASHTVSVESARELVVSGSELTINADHVAKLTVDTANNTVNATVKSDADPSAVLATGAQQTLNLTLASATTIDIEGASIVVNWTAKDGAPDPTVNIGGINNAVNKVQ